MGFFPIKTQTHKNTFLYPIFNFSKGSWRIVKEGEYNDYIFWWCQPFFLSILFPEIFNICEHSNERESSVSKSSVSFPTTFQTSWKLMYFRIRIVGWLYCSSIGLVVGLWSLLLLLLLLLMMIMMMWKRRWGWCNLSERIPLFT